MVVQVGLELELEFLQVVNQPRSPLVVVAVVLVLVLQLFPLRALALWLRLLQLSLIGQLWVLGIRLDHKLQLQLQATQTGRGVQWVLVQELVRVVQQQQGIITLIRINCHPTVM